MDQPIFDIIMQDEYDSWGASLPSHNWCCNTLVEVAFIVKALDLKKNQCVLDLFCSWGRHVVELVDKGYNVKGLDRSEELIDKATEIAKSKNIKIDFIIANILTWNEKDKYDVIYSLHSSVFEAWRTEAEIIKYLSKICGLLRKNGKYLFGWNNNWNRADVAEKRWKRVLQEQGIKSFEGKLPFYYYGYDEQKRIIEKCEFTILNVFNDYSINMVYDSLEPGLVFIVEK